MTKIIWYNELAKNNCNIEQREHAIKELSDKICSRRKEYASILEHDLVNIRMDKDQILELITNISKSYNVLSKNKRDELQSKCQKLKTAIENYEETSSNLCIRFRNQKIKVVAFGPKSQGKSTFTCLYTGLDESVVSVKQAGNDDKTGATSVILHRKNKELEIRVFLKSQEELLSIINSSLKALSSYNLDMPGTVTGVYKSWTDFMTIMNNHTEKGKVFKKLYSLRNTAKVEDFTSNVAVLMSVFRTENKELGIKGESDFSEVLPKSKISDEIKYKGIKISKSDLPMYNDMQHTGNQRYMTVSHIKIYTDLKRQNMFENFEICDTKGLSEDAGGSAHENLIYKQLNEADAAFSIFMLKTGDLSQSYYEALANKKLSNFASKHFVILNIAEDGFTESTPKVAHDIKAQNSLANKVYIGAFKTQSYDGKMIDAKLFADSLIFDMLETVVTNTKQQDDFLINGCNKLQSEVIICKNELVKVLSDIQDESKNNNVENILLESIEKLRLATIKVLKEEAKNQEILLSDTMNEKDYSINTQRNNEYYNKSDNSGYTTNNSSSAPKTQEQLIRMGNSDDLEMQSNIIRMITAADDETCEKLLKKDDENLSACNIAIDYILEKKVKGKAGENVKMNGLRVSGTASTMGGYIDSVCSFLYDEIDKNINKSYSPSHEIGNITDMRKVVFQKVWDSLKLKELIGEFGEESLTKYNNNVVAGKWYTYYTETIKDQCSSAIIPQQSYNILVAYFNNMKYNYKSNETIDASIVDWGKLKQAIHTVYNIYDFEGRIIEKLSNEKLLKHNVIRKLYASLANPNFINDIKSLYIGHNPESLLKWGIIDEPQHEKITNKEKWDALFNARELLSSKSVTSLHYME